MCFWSVCTVVLQQDRLVVAQCFWHIKALERFQNTHNENESGNLYDLVKYSGTFIHLRYIEFYLEMINMLRDYDGYIMLLKKCVNVFSG